LGAVAAASRADVPCRKANSHADSLLLFEKRASERQRYGSAAAPVLSARANLEGVGRGTLVEVDRRHAVSARGAGGGLEEEILLGRAKKLCMIASGTPLTPTGSELQPHFSYQIMSFVRAQEPLRRSVPKWRRGKGGLWWRMLRV
jgi:hypothetical protein